MSDEEEESMSEGFSASEDEWKPGKDVRGGESSDDDDSDFETPKPSSQNLATGNKKKETKSRGATKQGAVKKRKPPGQSLRTKLYNKYRPPPKTMTSPSSLTSNSPSTSKTASKNAKMPNECNEKNADEDSSSSDSSLGNNYVDPNNISYFDFEMNAKEKSKSPIPTFDCNAGIEHLTDSNSESEDDSSGGETKPFDFRHLLEKANSLERAKENIEKSTAAKGDNNVRTKVQNNNDSPAMDINSLLALGEKQSKTSMEDHESLDENEPLRLNKTKSRRIKRQKKPKTVLGKSGGANDGHGDGVGGGDTDDSDWEEVAGMKVK